MIAEELINQMIPPLKVSDSAEKAKKWMEEFRLTQLPVVENNNFLGLLEEQALYEKEDFSGPISNIRLVNKELVVKPSSHFYDVIKLASKNKLQIVPVVSDDAKFVGVISVNETSFAMAQMFATQGPGGIIVLSMQDKDYSLSQISRLVEANDAKILSSFVSNDELDPNKIKLTLKLSRTDLTRIIATFERYDYKIIANFQENELTSHDKERLDLLFKYLNI